MSTIKADNFTWKSGEAGGQAQYTVPGERVILGPAKGWVNFTTATTSSIRTSYNHSSLVDNGTGDTTLNLTTAMLDVYFCLTGMGHRSTGSLNYNPNPVLTSSTVSTYGVRTHDYNSDSACDSAVVCVDIFR
jgi:hypothetical protein